MFDVEQFQKVAKARHGGWWVLPRFVPAVGDYREGTAAYLPFPP